MKQFTIQFNLWIRLSFYNFMLRIFAFFVYKGISIVRVIIYFGKLFVVNQFFVLFNYFHVNHCLR